MEELKKTKEESRKISEIIKELQDWQKEIGDVEVVIANIEQSCFDGFGKIFTIKSASSDKTFLGIIRSNLVIKP